MAVTRREFLKGSVVAGAGLAAGVGMPSLITAQGKEPVKIGVLHSLSGTMAISEVSLRDVVLMAVGKIQPVVVDPASNWDLFAEKAKQLLLQDKVAVVFGCWTSVSRKSVLPVFENNNGLLFYPVQYEGEECSKNVFYTGACPNQQLIPGAEYLMSKEGGSYKKFYLLGTDYVFPRTANKILRAFLVAKGVPDANIEEEYTPFSHQTATCPSTRSSPTRACARKTRRSWRTAWPRTSCAAWTPRRSSATSRRGTTSSPWTRRRTRSS